MSLTRRQVLGLLASGTVVASGLLLPTRTIFLPPHGGWVTAQKRMEIESRYAHIWQDALDEGVVTIDVSKPDHLQLWTSAPLESQPLKDWRQFVIDWRRERGENYSFLKEKLRSHADAIVEGFKYSSSNIAAASDSLSVMAAARRAAQIREGRDSKTIYLSTEKQS